MSTKESEEEEDKERDYSIACAGAEHQGAIRDTEGQDRQYQETSSRVLTAVLIVGGPPSDDSG